MESKPFTDAQLLHLSKTRKPNEYLDKLSEDELVRLKRLVNNGGQILDVEQPEPAPVEEPDGPSLLERGAAAFRAVDENVVRPIGRAIREGIYDPLMEDALPNAEAVVDRTVSEYASLPDLDLKTVRGAFVEQVRGLLKPLAVYAGDSSVSVPGPFGVQSMYSGSLGTLALAIGLADEQDFKDAEESSRVRELERSGKALPPPWRRDQSIAAPWWQSFVPNWIPTEYNPEGASTTEIEGVEVPVVSSLTGQKVTPEQGALLLGQIIKISAEDAAALTLQPKTMLEERPLDAAFSVLDIAGLGVVGRAARGPRALAKGLDFSANVEEAFVKLGRVAGQDAGILTQAERAAQVRDIAEAAENAREVYNLAQSKRWGDAVARGSRRFFEEIPTPASEVGFAELPGDVLRMVDSIAETDPQAAATLASRLSEATDESSLGDFLTKIDDDLRTLRSDPAPTPQKRETIEKLEALRARAVEARKSLHDGVVDTVSKHTDADLAAVSASQDPVVFRQETIEQVKTAFNLNDEQAELFYDNVMHTIAANSAKAMKISPEEWIRRRVASIGRGRAAAAQTGGLAQRVADLRRDLGAASTPAERKKMIEGFFGEAAPDHLRKAGMDKRSRGYDWVKLEGSDLEVAIPGGLKGLDDGSTFTYMDLITLKAQGLDPSKLPADVRVKLYKKLFASHKRDLGKNPLDTINRLMFAMVSPQLSLAANEALGQLLRVGSAADIDDLAEMWEVALRRAKGNPHEAARIAGFAWQKRMGLQTGGRASKKQPALRRMFTTATNSAIGNAIRMAWLYKKDPAFFVVRSGESAKEFTQRIAAVTRGGDAKVASFASLVGDPEYLTDIATIDSHMVGELNKIIDDLGLGTKKFTQAELGSRKVVPGNKDVPDAARGVSIGDWTPDTDMGGKVPLVGRRYEEAVEVLAAARRADGLDDVFSLGEYQWYRWDNRRGKFEPHLFALPGTSGIPKGDILDIGEGLANLADMGYIRAGRAANLQGKVPPSLKSIVLHQDQASESVLKGMVEFGEDGRAVVRGFEAADFSTAVHEWAHVWRRSISGPDLDTVERWAGVRNGAWTTEAEERFARAFEKYIRTGKAPNPSLQEVFERFREWMVGIYKNLKKGELRNVKMSKEITEVFDRYMTPGGVDDAALKGATKGGPKALAQETASVLEGASPSGLKATRPGETIVDEFKVDRSRFTDPEASPLATRGWVIITGWNPGAATATAEANATANRRLLRDLKAATGIHGKAIIPVRGSYGAPEEGFLVVGMRPEEGLRLGQKYGQESILTPEGLLYGDGTLQPKTGLTFDDAATDFYTEMMVDGKPLRWRMDFDFEQPRTQFQPDTETIEIFRRGRTPREVMDPAFEGQSLDGREWARKKSMPDLWVSRMNYGEVGVYKEPRIIDHLPHEHRAKLDRARIYDMSKDPEGMIALAADKGYVHGEVMSFIEREVAKSGRYDGLMFSDSSTGARAGHVLLFKPQGVTQLFQEAGSAGRVATKTALAKSPVSAKRGIVRRALVTSALGGAIGAGMTAQDGGLSPLTGGILGAVIANGARALRKPEFRARLADLASVSDKARDAGLDDLLKLGGARRREADLFAVMDEVMKDILPDEIVSDRNLRSIPVLSGAVGGAVGGMAGHQMTGTDGSAVGAVAGALGGAFAASTVAKATTRGARFGFNPYRTWLRAFDEGAGMPEDVLLAKRVFQNQMRGHVNEIKDTSLALSKFDDETQSLVQMYLGGEIALDALPEAARGPAAQARYLFDRITLDLIDVGIAQGDMAEVLVNNLGTYVPRMYLLYEKTEGFDDLLRWMRENRVTWKQMSNQNYLKRRADVPPEIRAIWGEITDRPGYLLGKHGVHTESDIFFARYANWLAASDNILPKALTEGETLKDIATRLGVRMPKTPEEAEALMARALTDRARRFNAGAYELAEWDGKRYVKIPDQKRYGKLAGKFLDEDIAFDLMASTEVAKGLEAWMRRMTALFKANKVTHNPASLARNYWGGLVMADLGGVGAHRQDLYVRAVRDMAGASERYLEARRAGLFGGEFFEEEIAALLDDVSGAESVAWAIANNVTGRVLEKTTQAAQRVHTTTEQMFRMVMYNHARDALKLDVHAAVRYAHRYAFDWADTPDFIRTVRSSPFGAPFISFSYKALPRVFESAVAVGDPRKAMRFWKYPLIMGAVNEIMSREYGFVEEPGGVLDSMKRVVMGGLGFDAQGWKRFLPDYVGNNQVLLPWTDRFGRFQAFDMTWILPWGDIGEVGKGQVGQALARAGIPFPRQLEPSNPFMQTMVVGMTGGKDPFTGKNVIPSLADPGEASLHMFKFLVRSWMPSWLPPGGYAWEKGFNSATGRYEVDPNTPTPLTFGISEGLGLRTRPFHPDTSIEYLNRQFQREYREAIGEVMGEYYKGATDAHIDSRISTLEELVDEHYEKTKPPPDSVPPPSDELIEILTKGGRR